MLSPATPLITGVAASTCHGVGIERLFDRFQQGMCQHRTAGSSRVDYTGRWRLSAPAPQLAESCPSSELKDHLAAQLVAAVDRDLSQHLAKLTPVEQTSTSISLGNTTSNLDSHSRFFSEGVRHGYAAVDAADFSTTLLNYPAVQLAHAFSLHGANTTMASGMASGLAAIGHAAMRIRLGKETSSLAGGASVLNEYNCGLLENWLSPSGQLRPFHPDRDGTVAAEGIGILLLQAHDDWNVSQSCGRAAILGHAVATAGIGERPIDLQRRAVTAIRRAIHTSDLTVEDIDAVFPSANGTDRDDWELEIVRETFGQRTHLVPVYPTKAIHGECLTAAAPLQCLAAVYAIEHGRMDIHSGATLHDALLLPVSFRRCECALVFSLGLDHTFSALVIAKV